MTEQNQQSGSGAEGPGSKLPPEAELRRILGLYKTTVERALHYHSKMWEAANLFFWGFSLVISASFAVWWLEGIFPGDVGRRFRLATEILAIVLAIGSLLLAVYGKRVVAQERTLFAYEHQVRKKLEQGLGWTVEHPAIERIRQLTATGAQWSGSNFAYRQYGGFRELVFDDQDKEKVGRTGADKRGAYGIIGLLFSMAILVSVGAILGYSIATGVREGWWDLRLAGGDDTASDRANSPRDTRPATANMSATPETGTVPDQ